MELYSGDDIELTVTTDTQTEGATEIVAVLSRYRFEEDDNSVLLKLSDNDIQVIDQQSFKIRIGRDLSSTLTGVYYINFKAVDTFGNTATITTDIDLLEFL